MNPLEFDCIKLDIFNPYNDVIHLLTPSNIRMYTILFHIEIEIEIKISLCLLVGLYFLCDIGNNVMQRYEHIGQTVYQLNWYLLPFDMQMKIPTVLAMTQKNIFIRGFARFH